MRTITWNGEISQDSWKISKFKRLHHLIVGQHGGNKQEEKAVKIFRDM